MAFRAHGIQSPVMRKFSGFGIPVVCRNSNLCWEIVGDDTSLTKPQGARSFPILMFLRGVNLYIVTHLEEVHPIVAEQPISAELECIDYQSAGNDIHFVRSMGNERSGIGASYREACGRAHSLFGLTLRKTKADCRGVLPNTSGVER